MPKSSGPPRPDGYAFSVWRPSPLDLVPPSAPRRTYEIWWLFHTFRGFSNRHYSVVLATREDEVVHRLALFPSYFRFPFMQPDDLQIGDVWTDERHRGRGLARHAVRFAMEQAPTTPAFWYVTHDSNIASVCVARAAGLEPWGRAMRTRRWGVRLLGHFDARPG